MPENNLDKFKQILSKLPEDKRKLLYERLHDLPQSEREPFISDFVKKYDDRQSKQEPKKVSSSAPSQTGKKPAPHKGQAPAGKTPVNKAPANKNGAHTSPANKAPANKASELKAPVNAAQPKNAPANKAPMAKKPASGKPVPHNAATAPKKPSSGKPVAHNEAAHKKPVPHNEVSSHNKPVTDKEQAPKKASKVKELPKNEPAPQKIEAAHVTEPEEETKPVKKNASTSIIIGILTALFVVGALYMVYIFNKDKIDGKFNQMFGMPVEETFDTEADPGIIGPEPSNSYPTSTPVPTPTPSPVPIPDDHPDLTGLVIVIDPGHQAEADTELEESIPGSTAEKERASQGAVGVVSKTKEYELTLEYALIMKQYLEGCGAEVILTRETNDVNISNIERAKFATAYNADYFLRLHADSAPDEEISGVKVYVPSTGKYSSSAASDGKKLADAVADSIGSTSLGCVQSNMYTGLNHADSIKSYQLVIGYLSNESDDALLGDPETPYNTAVAVAEFFGG